MDNCCNPIQYYSTLSSIFFSFFLFLTFTLSTSPLFVTKPLRSFYRQIQEKKIYRWLYLGMYLLSYIYIYILDRFNFNSIAHLDRSKLSRPPPESDLFRGASETQQDFDPNDHVERLDSRETVQSAITI